MIEMVRSLRARIVWLSLLFLSGFTLYAPSIYSQECKKSDIPRQFEDYLVSVEKDEYLARYFSDTIVRDWLDHFAVFHSYDDVDATVANSKAARSRLRFGHLFGEILKTRLSSLPDRQALSVVYQSKRFGEPRLVVLAYVCQGGLWRIDGITYESRSSVKGWEDW